MKKLLTPLLLVLCVNLISSQNIHPFVFPLKATLNVGQVKEDWNPVLRNLEMPSPIPGSEQQRVNAIKDSLEHVYAGSEHAQREMQTATAPAPLLNRNFQGNTYNNSVPNDNELAVSNGGKLVSVQNSTIFKYDLGTAAALGTQSLSAFSSALPNPNFNYDPKVIYDPGADRFICVFLNGSTDSTTSITVAFSQTGDPNGTWNFYSLPGNPLNNHLWTDYPALAVSDKELFITVNLLKNNMSWQTGWVQSIIWQINKQSGFTGASLGSLLHTGIQYNGRGIRNLCPVKGGSMVTGPGMYFLSDRNLDSKNDTVFLVHVTDTTGAAGLTVTESSLITGHAYFMPTSARQPGPSISSYIATNDSRILGAFIENNQIQFVCNTLDTAHGKTGVYHGTIRNVNTTPVLSAHILGDTLLYYGYPNISYTGQSPTDNSSMISFDHSALSIDPGFSAIAYDGNGTYSVHTLLKQGLGYMNILAGTQRWGDYSGSQRKYDQPGVVWVNGLYGTAAHQNSTWIAELAYSPAGIVEKTAQASSTLYPNPLGETMNVSFNLDQQAYLSFEVYDMQGRLVKLLGRDKVKAGQNLFSFCVSPLTKGVYILRISNGEKQEFTKRFVKE
ncbi:MAG: T9SS type A sorting domain-containing protein [Bacteroidia bacterium]